MKGLSEGDKPERSCRGVARNRMQVDTEILGCNLACVPTVIAFNCDICAQLPTYHDILKYF